MAAELHVLAHMKLFLSSLLLLLIFLLLFQLLMLICVLLLQSVVDVDVCLIIVSFRCLSGSISARQHLWRRLPVSASAIAGCVLASGDHSRTCRRVQPSCCRRVRLRFFPGWSRTGSSLVQVCFKDWFKLCIDLAQGGSAVVKL